MSLITLKFPCTCAADSKTGGRNENQDSYGACDTIYGSLVIVCDGMGGGPGGKTASTLAVQAIKYAITEIRHENETRAEILHYAINYANNLLLDKQAEFPELRGMGTTCAVLLINKDSAIIAHVGDSRVYRIRDKQKSFRTKDHSKVGEMVRRGLLTEEQARLSAESNIITKALGRSNVSEPEIEEIGFEKGDRFVLCSDGIWGTMPEAELIKRCSEKKSAEALVETITIYVDTLGSSQGGHHDNLTLAILEPSIDSKYKEPMNKKAKRIIYALTAVCLLSILFNGFQHLRLSRLRVAEETIAHLSNTCDTLKKNNTELLDSINSIQKEALQSIEDAKEGGKGYAEKLMNCIDSLNKRVSTLEKEKDNLQNQLDSARQKQATTTKEQEDATKSPANPFETIKSDFESLKNCTGKTLTDCGNAANKIQKSIIDFINKKLKETKTSSKDKEKLKKIKDFLSNEKFDKSIEKRKDGSYGLTKVAKERIDAIIK